MNQPIPLNSEAQRLESRAWPRRGRFRARHPAAFLSGQGP
jgi:hypothetical protein